MPPLLFLWQPLWPVEREWVKLPSDAGTELGQIGATCPHGLQLLFSPTFIPSGWKQKKLQESMGWIQSSLIADHSEAWAIALCINNWVVLKGLTLWLGHLLRGKWSWLNPVGSKYVEIKLGYLARDWDCPLCFNLLVHTSLSLHMDPTN